MMDNTSDIIPLAICKARNHVGGWWLVIDDVIDLIYRGSWNSFCLFLSPHLDLDDKVNGMNKILTRCEMNIDALIEAYTHSITKSKKQCVIYYK
jgi:hypothetical protein